MNISCTQENLARGLSIVSRLATSRSTLPILANILISTDKGRLRLAATDLEIGVTTWVGAKIDEEGGITIPSRTLCDFINTNTDKTISLQVKDNTLHIKSDHYEANIKGMDVNEYPLIPEINTAPICEIPAAVFKETIMQTVFAAATDETRPVLGGINLRFAKEEVKMVATDSYRLAEKRIKAELKSSASTEIIVPSRTIAEIARIIQGNEEKVAISLNENQILFSLGNTQLISRLVEGSFPAYEQIIPKSHETRVVLPTGEFTNALKMASLFARESANNIRVKVKKGSAEIIAVSPQIGDNISVINAETEGKELEIAFNARYILDALNVIGTPEVILELTDKLSPGVLRPIKQDNYLYVIMPLRVEDN